MNTGPVLVFPPSIEHQVQEVPVRPSSAPLVPVLGGGSNGKSPEPQVPSSAPVAVQDAVEVQWNTANRVMVYEFLNQQGSLILQIPSTALLSLAQAISQELAQESAPKEPAPVEGGKKHGHLSKSLDNPFRARYQRQFVSFPDHILAER